MIFGGNLRIFIKSNKDINLLLSTYQEDLKFKVKTSTYKYINTLNSVWDSYSFELQFSNKWLLEFKEWP